MKQTSGPTKMPAGAFLQDIRRAARRQFPAEERIRIVLEGLRGEDGIAAAHAGARASRRPCTMAGPRSSWTWAKKRLAGDTARSATSDEVKELRREASALREVVADLTLENRLLRKGMSGAGEDDA